MPSESHADIFQKCAFFRQHLLSIFTTGKVLQFTKLMTCLRRQASQDKDQERHRSMMPFMMQTYICVHLAFAELCLTST